ncbi:hypothetical protein TrST_g12955 [Triparma strigata]|uniref:Cation-transporting P-type ATPase C-terminal domain-containing protein n=1 Tax=Triparma strigata TaxID=1606541 RepID=A0A9W7BB81_9STRA|nr:hypothetical protein TrST_g12955 [Triparma strigata]
MDDLASMGQTLDGALQLLKLGSEPELADDSLLNVFEAQQAIDFMCLPKKYSNPNTNPNRLPQNPNSDDASSSSQSPSSQNKNNDNNDVTPQTSDLYPCFRRSSSSSSAGRWYLLPSALLVAGDVIAMNSESDRTGLKGCDVTRIEEPKNYGGEGGSDTNAPSTPLTRQQFTSLHSSLLNLISGGGLSIYRLNSTVLHSSASHHTPPNPTHAHPTPSTHLQLLLVRKNLLFFNSIIFLLLLVILPLNYSFSTSPLPLPLLLNNLLIPILTGCSGLTLYASSTFYLECVGIYRITTSIKTFSKSTSPQKFPTLFNCILERIKNTNLKIPPPSSMILERFPSISRICIVDDDLICGSKSCSPKNILLPTCNGMKLLDVGEKFRDDDSEESDEEDQRKMTMQSMDYDSDSSDDERVDRSKRRRRRRRKRRKIDELQDLQGEASPEFVEMEFEDPRWWEHLPSLKGIGLAAMMVEKPQNFSSTSTSAKTSPPSSSPLPSLQTSLIKHVSDLPRRWQLISLASCIGFNAEDMKNGGGDLASFNEKLRIHFIKRKLHEERNRADYHALGLEEARIRGKLFPHISSVIIEDSRSKTFQMLSVGEAELAINKCSQLWEGETSTIFPLSPIDRKAVLDTARNWILEDLSVVAFTYAPIPYTFESKADPKKKVIYLVDNSGISPPSDPAVQSVAPQTSASFTTPSTTPSAEEDYYWKLTENQVFLGLLGSTSGPRRFIAPFIRKCNHSGVRFVYFSPRNMRRSKELASKLGLEMGWNCAISLRSLHGQEHDEHRMISSYADWDVNAKLPHGISEIRKHLVDVDNVPLLVSLFTDSTEDSTKDMVNIFKEHSDTVLVLGCSHRAKNMQIFGSSDVAIGVNVESEANATDNNPPSVQEGLEFASRVITRECFFNIELSALPHLHDIIEISRASLEAATAATQFIVVCSLSLSISTLLCSCTPNTSEMYVDGAGAIIFLLLLCPALAVGIAFGDGDSESMRRCPVKSDPTDPTMVFPGRKELTKRSFGVAGRALCNALGSFAVGLMAISSGNDDKAPTLILLELSLCAIVGSLGSTYRADVLWVETNWKRNHVYICICLSSLALNLILTFTLAGSAGDGILWPFFLLWPFVALLCGELIKNQIEKVIFDRAALLRRLEFETRLGMWSPR